MWKVLSKGWRGHDLSVSKDSLWSLGREWMRGREVSVGQWEESAYCLVVKTGSDGTLNHQGGVVESWIYLEWLEDARSGLKEIHTSEMTRVFNLSHQWLGASFQDKKLSHHSKGDCVEGGNPGSVTAILFVCLFSFWEHLGSREVMERTELNKGGPLEYSYFFPIVLSFLQHSPLRKLEVKGSIGISWWNWEK